MMLDAPVYSSRLHLGLWLLYFGIISLLVLTLRLPWWQYGALMVFAIILIYSALIKSKLRHLACFENGLDWQFLVATYQGEALWQGTVYRVQDYGFCLILFANIHRPSPMSIKWVIFLDMLDEEDYRILKMLTKFT